MDVSYALPAVVVLALCRHEHDATDVSGVTQMTALALGYLLYGRYSASDCQLHQLLDCANDST